MTFKRPIARDWTLSQWPVCRHVICRAYVNKGTTLDAVIRQCWS